MMSSSPRCLYAPSLRGPPLAINWGTDAPLIIDGTVLAPLSLWMSIAIPPAIAFRTDFLKSRIGRWDFDCPVHLEKIILFDACVGRRVAIAPKIGAFHRKHADNYWGQLMKDPKAFWSQWNLMLKFMENILQDATHDWRADLKHLFNEAAEMDRLDWLSVTDHWPIDSSPLCAEARGILLASWPAGGPGRSLYSKVRRIAREFLPPIMTTFIKKFVN